MTRRCETFGRLRLPGTLTSLRRAIPSYGARAADYPVREEMARPRSATRPIPPRLAAVSAAVDSEGTQNLSRGAPPIRSRPDPSNPIVPAARSPWNPGLLERTGSSLGRIEGKSVICSTGETVGRSFITTAQTAGLAVPCPPPLLVHQPPRRSGPPVRSREPGRASVRARRRRAQETHRFCPMVLGPHRAHYHDNRGRVDVANALRLPDMGPVPGRTFM